MIASKPNPQPILQKSAQGFWSPIDEPLLERIVSKLLKVQNCKCILLFGSRAYGQPLSESDVDLLVVTETQRDTFAVAGELHYALSPRDFAMDLIVMTPEMVRHRRGRFDPFFQEIISKGRVLYGNLP